MSGPNESLVVQVRRRDNVQEVQANTMPEPQRSEKLIHWGRQALTDAISARWSPYTQ